MSENGDFLKILQFLICISLLKYCNAIDNYNCKNFLPKPCKCTEDWINCTDLGLTNTDIFVQIREDRFPNVSAITITGNDFKALEANLFGPEVKLPAVKWIDLSNNQIRSIHSQAFRGLPNLEELILSYNSISVYFDDLDQKHVADIPLSSDLQKLKILRLTDAFEDSNETLLHVERMLNESQMKELTELQLDDNKLTRLSPNMFCNFPKLEKLSLADNYLKTFKVSVDCIRGLHKLDLQGNDISYVDSKMMTLIDDADNLGKVNLTDNPFDCNCYLKSFISWIQDHIRLVSKEEMTCAKAEPQNFLNERLLNVPVDSLRCPNDGAGYIHAIYIIIGVVMVGLITLILCLFYANKRFICRKIKIPSPVRTSMGYSRIAREAESEAQPEPEMV